MRYEPDTPANEVNHPGKHQNQFQQNPKTILPKSQDGFCQITKTILPNSKNSLPKALKHFAEASQQLKPYTRTTFAKIQNMFAEIQNHFCRNQPITKTIHSHNFCQSPKHVCRNPKPFLPKRKICVPNSKIMFAKTQQPCFKLALRSNTPKHNSTNTDCLYV